MGNAVLDKIIDFDNKYTDRSRVKVYAQKNNIPAPFRELDYNLLHAVMLSKLGKHSKTVWWYVYENSIAHNRRTTYKTRISSIAHKLGLQHIQVERCLLELENREMIFIVESDEFKKYYFSINEYYEFWKITCPVFDRHIDKVIDNGKRH